MPDAVKIISGDIEISADNPLPVSAEFTAGDINIGNVDILSVVPGVAAVNLGKAEDAVHASSDVGVMFLAVRKDTASAVAADGDYIPVIVDANGRLHVVDVGTVGISKAEDAVHASGDTGIMSLAVRRDTPTALATTDGDYIPVSTDANGRLWVALSALPALIAGESVIGKVAGTALVVTPTITVDTAVYAAGDTVGGKLTLANAVRVSGGSSLLYSIHIFDRSNQKPTGNILLFNADPTAATTTDNAAFVYSTDDFKQLTRVPIAASDYVTINSKASAGLTNIGRMVKAASGTSLYAVFVTDGAPDFVAATDLQIIFNFIPVD